MHGFRTQTPALAAIMFTLLAGPALASGVGGSFTDTPSQATITNNVSGGNNVSVTKNIDTSSSIAVNTEINGQNIGYGLNGANVLNNISGRTSDAAISNQNSHASALQTEGVILNALGLPAY